LGRGLQCALLERSRQNQSKKIGLKMKTRQGFLLAGHIVRAITTPSTSVASSSVAINKTNMGALCGISMAARKKNGACRF
jgi:hypothetical protein